MARYRVTSNLLVLALGLVSGSALGEPADFQVGFGPYVGGGVISTGAKVRNTSGYTLSLERGWDVGGGFHLGPRLELGNCFVNAKAKDGERTSVATYDNRIVAGGFRLAHAVGGAHTFAQGAYLTGVAGRAYSKLSIDESTERTYVQSLYGNISGNYFAGELGAWVPLKGSFGVNLAALGSLYRANQANASGTYAGDEIDATGALSLVEGEREPRDGSLDERVVMRTYAFKLGLALGF